MFLKFCVSEGTLNEKHRKENDELLVGHMVSIIIYGGASICRVTHIMLTILLKVGLDITAETSDILNMSHNAQPV